LVRGHRLERKLTEIWSEELGMDTVGITDNYEDFGGDSLLAASIFARIETTFGDDRQHAGF